MPKPKRCFPKDDRTGSRPRAKPDPDRWVPLPPNPEHIALLRGILAKRYRLSTREFRAFSEMLKDAVKRPLSDGARKWAEHVSERVRAEATHIGDELPALDFGPLPLKPPGRAA